jgi:type VI secretion system protein VasJ
MRRTGTYADRECRLEGGTAVAESSALASLGSSPIAGASAAGASARYEPEFEKLSQEIAKLESVAGKSSIRWEDVVSLSTTLLSGKTKDLLVAGYLTLGLLERKGLSGLSTGLQISRDMVTTYWEGLFPEKTRLRARASALQWMSERVGALLAEKPAAGRSDREVLTRCSTLIKELDGLGADKFDGNPPDLSLLSRAIQEKLDAIPPDPPPKTEGSAPSETATAAAEAPPPPPEVDTPDGARQALSEMRERRMKAVRILREADPQNPLPYRLLRRCLWEEILEPPSGDLSGGDAGFAQEMEGKLQKGDYLGVLGEAETRLSNEPWWMDLNFLAVRAMEGLGRPYQAAKRAVEEEVLWLVRSVPELLELKFADGKPLASEGTRVWLEHELGFAGSSAPKPAGKGEFDLAVTEARKLVARKQFSEAMALLLPKIQALPHRRDRWLARLELAKLCVAAGKSDLALPQLEVLDEEARRVGLDEWEPALSADLSRELWRCHKSGPSPEKAREHFMRLCRLDPAAALTADGKK